MVLAGQEGGFLEDVLKRVADFSEAQEDLKAKVVGAMAYPVFLAVIGFLVLSALIIFFVPQFEPIFGKLADKGELPAITIGLLATSHFMQSYGIFLVAGAVGAFFVFRMWANTEGGRMSLDKLRLRLPKAGTGDLPQPRPVAFHPHSRHAASQRHSHSCKPSASAKIPPAIKSSRRRSTTQLTTSRVENLWPLPLPPASGSPRTWWKW